MLRRIINRIRQSEFIRNTATLASGTTVAQLISIGTAPIVYRIYEREDYGTLGLYMAITGVMGVLSTLQFTQAILLENTDVNARKALHLNRLLNLSMTVVIACIIIPYKSRIATFLGNSEIANWLFLVPLTLFFSGQNELFRVWANRSKEYKLLSLVAVISALIVPMFSISIGLIEEGPLGLFIGLLTSQIVPTLYLAYRLNKKYHLGSINPNIRELRDMAHKHRNFPKFALFSEFVNRFTHQVPVFILSKFVGVEVVGVYNLSVRMLGLPIQFLTSAISEVFRQRAITDFHQIGSYRHIYRKTFKTLLVISIPFVLISVLIGPNLFEFAFGQKWRLAGEFARYLSIMYGMKLIVSPLSYAFFIENAQREDLFWHILMVTLSCLLLYMPLHFELNVLVAVGSYALGMGFIYSIYLIRSRIFAYKHG